MSRHFLVFFFPFACIAIVAKIGVFVVVGIRVCLITVVIASTFFGAFVSVFIYPVLTALISMVGWLFAVITCCFGFFRVWFCTMFRHSVRLKFILGFKIRLMMLLNLAELFLLANC